jgi:hypothetical protein
LKVSHSMGDRRIFIKKNFCASPYNKDLSNVMIIIFCQYFRPEPFRWNFNIILTNIIQNNQISRLSLTIFCKPKKIRLTIENKIARFLHAYSFAFFLLSFCIMAARKFMFASIQRRFGSLPFILRSLFCE